METTPDPPSGGNATARVLLFPGGERRPFWARIVELVERIGFSTEVPNSGESLAEAARRARPDLIIFSGWNAFFFEELERLRETVEFQDIPVLTVCEAPSLDSLSEMIEAGVVDCLREQSPAPLVTARLTSLFRAKRRSDDRIELLQHEALRDPLTGLWNHRRLQERIHLELERSLVSGHLLSLLMVDIDHFKRTNDRFGHQSGDKLLQGFARILFSVARTEDTAARYGGDEFSLLLPGASRADAGVVASRIQASVQRGLLREEFPHSVSISVGISTAPEDASIAPGLIAAADMALYQAKRLGRNRIATVHRVEFRLAADTPFDFVGVGGDWNTWAPEQAPLTKGEDGVWKGNVLLPTGKNRYKFKGFLGDAGEWFPDYANPHFETDSFGGINSLVYADAGNFASAYSSSR